MVIECTDPKGHRFHFISFTSRNKRVYTDIPEKGVTEVSLVEEPDRYAKFICENCGEIKDVLVDKTKIKEI